MILFLQHKLLAGRQVLGLLLLLLLAGSVAQAQAPAWQTAVALLPSSVDSASAGTFTDAAGNMYLAGGFAGTISFGNTTLVSVGESDVYVAKWSSANQRFMWAQRAGGAGIDGAISITVSGTSVYITGLCESTTADFGSTTLPSAGSAQTQFVAKLNDMTNSSNFAWCLRAPGDWNRALAVAGNSVYIGGDFNEATATFGSHVLTNSSSANPYPNGFLAKITDAGNSASYSWAQRIGGTSGDKVKAVAVQGNSVYVTGYIHGTGTFGNLTLNSVDNGFLVKLTDAGSTSSFVWVLPGPGNALAVQGNSVYLAGAFNRPTINLGGIILNWAGTADVLVAKITDHGPSGSFVWAKQAGGPDVDVATAIAVSGANVYIAGTFSSATVRFGTTTLANPTAGSRMTTDVYVAKLTDTGSTTDFTWAQQATGADSEGVGALVVSGNNVLLNGGSSSPSVTFGNLSLISPMGDGILFQASLRDPALATTPSVVNSMALSLHPNPAHASATMQLPAVPGATQATLTLTDALGRTMRTQQLPLLATGTTAKLDLISLLPGLYRVQVQAGGQQLSRRLMVE
jgi:hypothetical protein